MGLLLVVCAGCSGCTGIGAFGDKVSTTVVDGQLHVLSCWDGDRLLIVRIVRPDGSEWSATAHDDDVGLQLRETVTMEQVEASGAYDLSGERPAKLNAGDHVYFETSEESRNYVLTAESLSSQDRLSC